VHVFFSFAVSSLFQLGVLKFPRCVSSILNVGVSVTGPYADTLLGRAVPHVDVTIRVRAFDVLL
jgi:hypothetical protein